MKVTLNQVAKLSKRQKAQNIENDLYKTAKNLHEDYDASPSIQQGRLLCNMYRVVAQVMRDQSRYLTQ